MAENLNYAIYDSPGRCYSSSSANCDTYGRLYTWAEALALPTGFPDYCNTEFCASKIGVKHRGLCPDGWHIPTSAEWDELICYVGDNCSRSASSFPYESATAGKYLKATSGWNSYTGQSGNGTDDFGFAALPGGCQVSGGYGDIGSAGYWWSTQEYGNDKNFAYFRIMVSRRENIEAPFNSKQQRAFSVRCIHD
jgi:uncharacterized protein (TIGR02145 family)